MTEYGSGLPRDLIAAQRMMNGITNATLDTMKFNRSEAMEMFVVYKYPTDYPDKFVVRRWAIGAGTLDADRDWFYLGDTLEEVRAKVPQHCICIRREPNDEPQIVEVWI